MTKWLNKKKFLKLKILDDAHIDLYYEAVFNISKIEIDGKLFGFELEVKTNTPFAYRDPKTIIIKNLKAGDKHSINDISQEEGYIYPYVEITVNANGNLKIHNDIENRSYYYIRFSPFYDFISR